MGQSVQGIGFIFLGEQSSEHQVQTKVQHTPYANFNASRVQNTNAPAPKVDTVKTQETSAAVGTLRGSRSVLAPAERSPGAALTVLGKHGLALVVHSVVQVAR